MSSGLERYRQEGYTGVFEDSVSLCEAAATSSLPKRPRAEPTVWSKGRPIVP